MKTVLQQKYTLTQRQADILAKLHLEMDHVHDEKLQFNQNNCTTCVIGHGLRAGIFGHVLSYNWEGYDNACMKLNLPAHVESYLFGSKDAIREIALKYKLPTKYNTTEDAKNRIECILDAAGYAIKYSYV